MRKISVNLNLSLDGVMQAPGRPDEDTRGGFKYGGWAGPYFDPEMTAKTMAEAAIKAPAMLFGRRTYEDFYSVWPNRTDNPFTEVLNKAEKYVVSTTLKEPLPWSNSTLLKGNAIKTIAALKEQPGKDFIILGSGLLVQSLMRYSLIDEFVLSIHPLILGSGRRLFPEDNLLAKFQLIDAKTSTTGVIVATYRTSTSH
jgi:dihydrofolate reductase